MTNKELEKIRAMGVALRAAQRELKALPSGKLKGRNEGLRAIALEARENVEHSLENCEEAYLEERFGLRYGQVAKVSLRNAEGGAVRFEAKILRCQFAGVSDNDPDKEAAADRLLLKATRHAPGQEMQGETMDITFSGVDGDELSPA
jgi:hypothetical protein